MSDPIRELENFATPPVPHLDATEVRRRGDQRRRRRQLGGAVAVAAAVAVIASTGAVLATGGKDDAVAPPATRPPQQLTAIPDDFPLDVGLTAAKVTDAAGLSDLDYCGTTPLAGLPHSDVRTAAVQDSTVTSTRTLYLLDDAKAADTARAAIVAAASDCTGGDPKDSGTVRVQPSGDDATWSTVTEVFPARPGTVASTEVVHAVTAGNALLVTSSFSANAPGGPGTPELAVTTRDALAELVNKMSLFVTLREAADLQRPYKLEEPPASAEVGQGDIGDLDLTRGFTDLSGDGGEQVGPAADLEGVDQMLACGRPLLSQEHLPTGRLLASNSGPEFFELRQVIAYRDAEAAKETFEALFRVVSDCPNETINVEGSVTSERTWQVFGSGNPESLVFSETPTEGLGGSLFRVSRFGRSLLVMMQGGEWSTDTVGGGLIGLDRSGDLVAPLLCAFTEQGC
ncbi:hypothetical protein ACLM5J_19980 [Nocardioides sp. Bht2]|uniref:hypothetical protein n=1 Tax=Nocardioides sp. Bht2 TaxID=3392297 RepID=UPI0039B5C159